MDQNPTTPPLYDELCLRIETDTRPIRARHPDQVQCRKGCDGCCRVRLALFPVEFDRLQAAFQRLPRDIQDRLRAEARNQWDRGVCPLLLDGACSLYEHRPVICRTHGFPLASSVRIKTQPRVSVCALNFTGTSTFEDQDLIDVDAVGMMLIGANLEYLKSIPASTSPAVTRPILDVLL
jgi:Fe-S-cluster containining protein